VISTHPGAVVASVIAIPPVDPPPGGVRCSSNTPQAFQEGRAMSTVRLAPPALVALAALAPGAALADLTAAGVWQGWQDFAAEAGFEVAADARPGDGRLTLENLSLTSEADGADSTTTVTGAIELVERGDGTVAVEVPAQLLTRTVVEGRGETVEQTATVLSEALEIVAREDGGTRVYDTTAGEVSVVLQVDDDEGRDEEEGFTTDVTVTMEGVESTARSGAGALAQSAAIDAMTIDAESTDGTTVEWRLAQVVAESDQALGGDLAMMAGSVAMTFAGSEMEVLSIARADAEATRVEATTGPGQLSSDTTDGGFAVSVSLRDLESVVAGADLPAPVTVTVAEQGMTLGLPTAASDALEPWGLSLTLRDLEADEATWALFDPTGQLPRTPATLLLDVTGEAEVTGDLMDPEAMTAAGPPLMPRSAVINQLLLAFGGAELTGSGTVAFEGAPIPDPVGTIEIALSGGLGLVDRLVALGVVPAAQAGMARGMIGMIARETGPDAYATEIEFAPGGGISVGGMQMR
jgi:hypothetical protein